MFSALLFFALQHQVVMRVAVTVPVDPPANAAAEVARRRRRRLLFWRKDPEVTLKWLPSPDLAQSGAAAPGTGYAVFRAKDSKTFERLDKNLLPGRVYVDSSVTKGVTYKYRVTAWVGKVQSAPSNVVKVTP